MNLASRSSSTLPLGIIAVAVLLAACAQPGGAATSVAPASGAPSQAAALVSPPAATQAATASPMPTPGPTIPAADIVYLALGDSNVYGSPAECGTPCVTYPHLLADMITAQTGKTVTLLDGSQHNRLTAPKLLAEIRGDTWQPLADYPVRTGGLKPREAIAAADLITITLAANQIPWYQDPDSCEMVYDEACIEKVEVPYIKDLDAILTEIDTLRAGKPTAVRITTFYNDLLKGPGYDPAWFEDDVTIAQATKTARTFLDRWNGDVCATAAKHGAACVDLYRAVNGPKGDRPLPAGWYSKDFGDLNQGGHTQFAEEIAKVGFEPLWAAP